MLLLKENFFVNFQLARMESIDEIEKNIIKYCNLEVSIPK